VLKIEPRWEVTYKSGQNHAILHKKWATFPGLSRSVVRSWALFEVKWEKGTNFNTLLNARTSAQVSPNQRLQADWPFASLQANR
jgi:hypothetical protein